MCGLPYNTGAMLRALRARVISLTHQLAQPLLDLGTQVDEPLALQIRVHDLVCRDDARGQAWEAFQGENGIDLRAS